MFVDEGVGGALDATLHRPPGSWHDICGCYDATAKQSGRRAAL